MLILAIRCQIFCIWLQNNEQILFLFSEYSVKSNLNVWYRISIMRICSKTPGSFREIYRRHRWDMPADSYLINCTKVGNKSTFLFYIRILLLVYLEVLNIICELINLNLVFGTIITLTSIMFMTCLKTIFQRLKSELEQYFLNNVLFTKS